jgi:hypothetical protein
MEHNFFSAYNLQPIKSSNDLWHQNICENDLGMTKGFKKHKIT